MQQEVLIAKDYLLLQKMRFGDIFEFEFNVDENVYQARILKLILQPLVENCIIHGIYPKGERGKITVTILMENKSIIIIIHDNGIGMDQNTISSVTDLKKDEKNFGIKGTLLRLQYFYEIQNFYKIESKLEMYTEITLRLPFQN